MNGLPERRIDVQFDDNRLLPMLYGEHDRHLARIESLLGVSLISRGNTLTISGPSDAAETAQSALNGLYLRLTRGQTIDGGEVDGAVRMAAADPGFAGVATSEEPRAPGPQATITRAEIALRTRRRGPITPRSPTQAAYLQALAESELVFGLGPAGTGKTYLAVAQAVALLTTGQVDRIVLSRPAVEAGERLGFLPGDLKEKVDPYLRPLYDALHDMLPAEQVKKRLESGEIEIAPLAFMRGRTLGNAFVILDEAQNTTPMQMKMFLTRLGEGGRMVITGDISQIDLPSGTRSGLRDALDILRGVEGVRFVRFTDADVVRHPMVARIIRAYDQADAREAARKQARRAGSEPGTNDREAGIVGDPE
ncbi:PhoH family protein [Azospirillum oryzae]|uniref:PhoH-like protein n=1 Tax=Azospirillum oryzae TaxID=286727 RepID=A0A6N1AI90_9PROT|nr:MULTISPECIES: PhoH family protein [Azospirillum]KAA0575640.1 phosphate starvation-inducible protein PhoH [Azospirillum sp. Sh1]KAA0586103.1 phosphate starvation-inducible protein PhoH [Azospirillum oryzae]QKS50979.1 PhoH family protein [Azospirillum oryzae]GLR83097.1 phosphate starvation protein PhoH [Azospirillum oryzae]